MLTVLTNIASTKVLWLGGHHPITTFSTVHEFGSQIALNIVKEVIEMDELIKSNISATTGK